MLRVVTVLVLLAGCATNKTHGEPQAPTPSQGDGVAGGEVPPPAVPDAARQAPTPASLYAECEQRVENPQAAGECTADADCAKAGCGSEVCTTMAAAAQVMTTCEDKLCFKVLDTCGCHDGQCTWTLKDEVPALQEVRPAPLPTRLP